MSFPYVVLYEDGGTVRCRTVGDAVVWASDHPGGTIYEKLGLSTAQKVCAEEPTLDPQAVARVIEDAKNWRSERGKLGEWHAANLLCKSVDVLSSIALVEDSPVPGPPSPPLRCRRCGHARERHRRADHGCMDCECGGLFTGECGG